MTDERNSSPANASQVVGDDNDDNTEQTLPTIARSTYLAWEKLRIVYNIVLAVITISIIAPGGLFTMRLFFLILEGAIAANILYFAGASVETYIKWLGYDRRWPRWVMFVGGTLLSILLVFGLLATELLPDQS